MLLYYCFYTKFWFINSISFYVSAVGVATKYIIFLCADNICLKLVCDESVIAYCVDKTISSVV